MSNSTGDDHLESTSNYNERRSRRKYYCEKYTEKPFGLEKYQCRIIYIGIAHILGFNGSYSCYTFQYPSVLPVGEPQWLKITQIGIEWWLVIRRKSEVKDYGILCFAVIVYLFLAGFGTTLGAHRYYTHKSYKAKIPLQILLVIMQTVSVQVKFIPTRKCAHMDYNPHVSFIFKTWPCCIFYMVVCIASPF